ncbi:thioredoxin family protein [Flammeovirgaceae bacterium SG7u.111]|nr:thioredoxin family protein [Flammeovirgaceae bacterium SG7u.132]WPO35203.1 thioredoxin family protein [Flammeovirgaceae bacterium SG7u.111]
MITQQSVISKETIEQAFTYQQYRNLLDQLFEEGKTTGPNQSEAMLEYAKINQQRMKRLDKTTKLSEEVLAAVQQLEKKVVWLVLTEGWCGDAAQNLPIINKIAEASSNIELRLILRDENLEIMDAYLTNGGRSIPKLIALDAETLEELGTWGPRPEPVQAIVNENREKGTPYHEYSTQIHKWYATDKTLSLQKEMVELMGKMI